MPAEPPSDVRFEIGHVLFIDIVGSSKLLIDEQSELIRKLTEIARGTEQVRLAETEGKLVRLPTGDGMALVFRNSLEAPVQCALEISKALKNHPELRVRVGIHSGPVNEISDVAERANIAGGGINIAQRVMDCGDAGHILLSKRAADDLAQYRKWQPYLHDLGECEVKHGAVISVVNLYTDEVGNSEPPQKFKSKERRGVPVPIEHSADPHLRKSALIAGVVVALVVLAVGGFLYLHRPSRKPTLNLTASDKSIAVLPFENLSRDPENVYLVEGVQDEILTRLAKMGDLKVISRTSTQRFRSSPDNLPEIAQRLGVAHILEGTVQRAPDRVRVTVQLINAATDTHVWADTFDRDLTDIFAVESDIAKAIAEVLQAKLTGSASHALISRPTENAEAYQFYLKGRYFWSKGTGANLPKSIQNFEQAIAVDARYALAYAGLADAYLLLPSYTGAAWKESFAKAKVAAQKALELDDNLAEPHASLAEVFCQADLNLSQALKEFRRAIELNPNYATAHSWHGRTLLAAGRFDEAIAELKRAVELDPFSVIINSQLAYVYLIAGRGDETTNQARKTIDMEPSFYWAHSLLGRGLQIKGDLAGAISEGEKGRELDEDPQVRAWLAHTYAAAGRKDEALQTLHELEELSKRRPSATYYLAIAHVALGEKEEALRLLEESFANPTTDLSGLKVDPLLDPLHGDPRYERLASKIVSADVK